MRTQLALQQSANIIFTPTQEEPTRPLCLRSNAPNKGTFLAAVRQAAFYCYNAMLDAPSQLWAPVDINIIFVQEQNAYMLFLFVVAGPATVEVIQQACLVDPSQFNF